MWHNNVSMVCCWQNKIVIKGMSLREMLSGCQDSWEHYTDNMLCYTYTPNVNLVPGREKFHYMSHDTARWHVCTFQLHTRFFIVLRMQLAEDQLIYKRVVYHTKFKVVSLWFATYWPQNHATVLNWLLAYILTFNEISYKT